MTQINTKPDAPLKEVRDSDVRIAVIDPASHEAFVYEQCERPVPHIVELFAASDALPDFGGATIAQGDDGRSTVVISRFAHVAAYEAFRSGRAATNGLGSADQSGTTSFPVHATRTFTAPAVKAISP